MCRSQYPKGIQYSTRTIRDSLATVQYIHEHCHVGELTRTAAGWPPSILFFRDINPFGKNYLKKMEN